MLLRSKCLFFFLFESLVFVGMAMELKSLKPNGTCPEFTLNYQSPYLKGFEQTDISQKRSMLAGCIASNAKDPNFVIYIKNNADNKVYLTFSTTETNPTKIQPHVIVLASPVPTTWIIYQQNTGNITQNYYVYPGSVVINGDTGTLIAKTTIDETFNPNWIDIQLKAMLENSVFNGNVKAYIEFQRADFVHINLGTQLPEDQSCTIKRDWKPPSDFISASYLNVVPAFSACSLLDSDIKTRVQFLVEVKNERLKTNMMLWLSGAESLSSGTELVIVLSTAYPVVWEVVTPFNIPMSCNLRFKISAGSSLSDDNIALTDGTSQKISHFQGMPFGNNGSRLLAKMSTASSIQSYVRFNQSVDFVELKLPPKPVKPPPKLPSAEEILMFVGHLKLACQSEICQLTIPSETYKSLDLPETQIRIGDEDCEIEMNEEDEDFISDDIEVGSCGLREGNNSYLISVILFVGKEIKITVSTPIPKMAVYKDLNRSEKLQFPMFYNSAKQDSFYVEISMASTDSSNGISIDECYLYADGEKSNPLYLIYKNCPVNKHVGLLLAYCPDNMHQQLFTFSQDLLLSFPNKDVSLACHVTTCDISDYSSCQSDSNSCYGMMDDIHDYESMESDYTLQAGVFIKADEITDQTIGPKKHETKFNSIKPNMVIFIGFCTFFIGIVLMVVLWLIHLHYKKKKRTYTNKFKDSVNYDPIRSNYDTMNGNLKDGVKGDSQTDQLLTRIPGLKINSKTEGEVMTPLLNMDPQNPLTPPQSGSSGEGDGGYSSNGKSKSGSLTTPRIFEEIAYMKEDVV